MPDTFRSLFEVINVFNFVAINASTVTCNHNENRIAEHIVKYRIYAL